MGKLRVWAWTALTILAGAVMFAAGTPFDEASSNISTWLPEWLVDAVPSLQSAIADGFAFFAGLAVFVLSSAILVSLTPWGRKMTKRLRSGLKGLSIINPSGEGTAVVSQGTPADIEDVVLVNFETGFDIDGAPTSRITDSSVTGHGESTGYRIRNSAETDLSGSESVNNKIGFDIDNSPGSNLSGSSARREPEAAGVRKYYPVKLPSGMKRKRD